ncbi:8640_t:CDS:2 [Funneliformis mosseae]|uniref:8640_t:CDS:1 n=1 Tax=Funneliformis mosseae TaxID=27381 RepID=A0A9N9HXL2_FUNMO|nr:8640_t:CDS:2 [Funneliformis mosseae]
MTSNIKDLDKRMESLSQVIPERLAKKVEKALLEVLESAIYQNFKESSKFVRDYLSYVKKLRLAENPDKYARYIARKLVSDEISYNTRLEKIQAWYRRELHNAKEIIQGLLNMSLTDD